MRELAAGRNVFAHASKKQLFLWALLGQSVVFGIIIAISEPQLNQPSFDELSRRSNVNFTEGRVQSIDVKRKATAWGELASVTVEFEAGDGSVKTLRVATTKKLARELEIDQLVDVAQSGRAVAAKQAPPIEFPFGLLVMVGMAWIALSSGAAAVAWIREARTGKSPAAPGE